MLIFHKGHNNTMQVYSVMTHVKGLKALQAGQSSQGTSEPITPVYAMPILSVKLSSFLFADFLQRHEVQLDENAYSISGWCAN